MFWNRKKKVEVKQKIVGSQPKEKPIGQFKALQNFFSIDTRSSYVKGQRYTIRSAHLERLVEVWKKEGKVK